MWGGVVGVGGGGVVRWGGAGGGWEGVGVWWWGVAVRCASVEGGPVGVCCGWQTLRRDACHPRTTRRAQRGERQRTKRVVAGAAGTTFESRAKRPRWTEVHRGRSDADQAEPNTSLGTW